MSIDGPGREQLRVLAARLKDAGDEGKGLRRELMKQISAAAEPLAREIGDVAHLKPYLPDRYAEVLAADISVTAQRIFASNPRVSVRAKGRLRKRKVALFDRGLISHPVYARGPQKDWTWAGGQTGGMKPGFFTDPCEKAVPGIRRHVLAAMTETARKITRG